MQEQLLAQLGELYRRLDSSLSSAGADVNPCGSCRECCTGNGLSLHHVTDLELEYIRSRVGPEKLESFKRFARRDGDPAVCPYFDEEQWGCGIYPHRPFSCRLFGHYRRADQALPEVCVFAGQEQLFQVGEYYQKVPQALELRDLVRKFWPYKSPSIYVQDPVGGDAPAPELSDALDRALYLQSEGRLQEALETMAESDLEETPYVLYCLALLLEGLGHHSEAVRALEQALSEVPDTVLLRFRKGCNLVALGRMESAVAEFRRTLKLEPSHTDARAMLAGCLMGLGQLEAAKEELEIVKSRDPNHRSVTRMLPLVEQEFERRKGQS